MLVYLLILFTVIPAVELYLLISVGRTIGAPETIGVIVLTGVIGSWIAKQQGASTWREIRQTMDRGEFPGGQLIDAVLIFAAGLLMITPGFMTDICGFLIMVPFCRKFVKAWLAGAIKRKIAGATVVSATGQTRRASPPGQSQVIDIQATEVHDDQELE